MTNDRNQPFGIPEVFNAHLELALANMHPHRATEAACQAVLQYVGSYEFVQDAYKGSDPNQPYRMTQKRRASEAKGGMLGGGRIKMGGR